MKCRRAKTRLPLYSGGELSWWRSVGVHRHLRSCPGCRVELTKLDMARAVVSDSLYNAPITDAAGSIVDDVMREVRADATPRARTPRQARRWAIAAAPVAVAAAVLLLVLALPDKRQEEVSVSDDVARSRPTDSPPVVEKIEGTGSKIVHFETDNPNVTIAWIFETPANGE
jgi:anti-sigma factor RsiW